MSKNYQIKKTNNLPAIGEIYDKNTKKLIGIIMYDKMLRYKTGNQAQGEHSKNKENPRVILLSFLFNH